MAIKALPTRAEIINTLTKILQSLHQCPEYNISFLRPLLPAFRITLRAIETGRELPQKELQWCEKLQTIAPPEESVPSESHSTDTTTQDSASAGGSQTTDATNQDNVPAEDSSTTNATTQDGDDASADSSTTDPTIQDDTSATQDNSTAAKKLRPHKKITHSLIDDEVITKFGEKALDFKSWANDPHKFWNPPAVQELQLPESTLEERINSHWEHAAEHKPKIKAQNLVYRLDSVVAYSRYRQKFPKAASLSLRSIKEQTGWSGEQAEKRRELLLGGRRRLQFCHNLSKDKADFRDLRYDDINFDDIRFGGLFLEIDDKIWDSTQTKNYNLMDQTIEELKSRNFTAISEGIGADLTTKILLHFRQAFIEEGKPASFGEKNTTATASDENDSAPCEESGSTLATPDGEESNTTVASEHSYTEVDLDGTRVSKRSRTEADLDARASKRPRTDLDNAITSEEDGLHMLVKAAEVTGQNATASEKIIVNLASGLHVMQLDNARTPNSETGCHDLNSVDIQGRDAEDLNGTGSEVSSRDEEPLPPDTNIPQLNFNNNDPNTIDPALLEKNTLRTGIQFDDGNTITFDNSLPHTNAPEFTLSKEVLDALTSLPDDDILQTGVQFDEQWGTIAFDNSLLHTNVPEFTLSKEVLDALTSLPDDNTP